MRRPCDRISGASEEYGLTDYSDPLRGSRREPVFNLPAVILALILLFVAIHGLRDYLLDARADAEMLRTFAFVPARLTAVFDMNAIAAKLNAIARDPSQLAVAKFFLGDASPQYWSLLTYAGLHGDWIHVGVNCLWLAAFGGPVAMRFGWLRFLLLFAVCAIAGASLHFLLHMREFTPVVGASASVSGIMAAAIRFVFQPGAPLGPRMFPLPLPPHLSVRLPAIPLSQAWRDRRVLQFTLLWLGINFIFGLVSVPLGVTDAPVAWEAHVGGFVAGFFLFSLFDPPLQTEPVVSAWIDTRYRLPGGDDR